MCSGDVPVEDIDNSHDSEQTSSSSTSVSTISKRRENSRYAARDRRSKEADLFAELREVTPIIEESPQVGAAHLDRIALLRVACSLCRLRSAGLKFLQHEAASAPAPETLSEQSLAESLDGFTLIVDADGNILYSSESVSLYLGLTQTDLIGCHLSEFLHPKDHEELRASLRSGEDDIARQLMVRMKTVISQRGRVLNYKSALYKAVLFNCRWVGTAASGGRVMLVYGSSQPAGSPPLPSARPCSSPTGVSLRDTPREQYLLGMFTTRHTCDMRFSFASEQFTRLLGIKDKLNSAGPSTSSLIGSSFYELIHPADLPLVETGMKELFTKGHSRTGFYRMLCGKTSIAWLQSEAITLSHTVKGQKGQYVLAVHHVLGIQDELDSWHPPSKRAGQAAAHPVLTKVKQEIMDVAEYFVGRQPQYVDCFDFTPLIEPLPANCTGENFHLHMSEYRPVGGASSSTTTILDLDSDHQQPERDSGDGSSLCQFNDDYEALLVQWLQRDDPNEMCPELALPLISAPASPQSSPTRGRSGSFSGGCSHGELGAAALGPAPARRAVTVAKGKGGASSNPYHRHPGNGGDPTGRHALPAIPAAGRGMEPDVPGHIDGAGFRPRSRTVTASGSSVHPTLPAASGHQVGATRTNSNGSTQTSGSLGNTLYSPITDSGCEEEEAEDCVILEEHNDSVGGSGETDFELEYQKCQAYAEEHGAELAPYCPQEELCPVLGESIDIEGIFPEFSLLDFHPAVKQAGPATGYGLGALLGGEEDQDAIEEAAINAFYKFVDSTVERESPGGPGAKKARLN